MKNVRRGLCVPMVAALAVIVGLVVGSMLAQTAMADEFVWPRTWRGDRCFRRSAARGGVEALKRWNGHYPSAHIDADGNFEFANLKPGTYRLTVTKPSFKTFDVSAIQVAQNQIFVQNVGMELGTLNETIEVAANQAQVETIQYAADQHDQQQTITDLPRNGRNWIFSSTDATRSSNPRHTIHSNFSTNGSQGQQNSYLSTAMTSMIYH